MQQDYSITKKIMLSLGVLLIILGILFLLYGFILFGNVWNTASGMMLGGGQLSMMWFLFVGVGGFLLVIGIGLVYLSQIKKVANYLATETTPAFTTMSQAVGKGIAEGMKQEAKLECPYCGYKEENDAIFCSNCGEIISRKKT